MAAGILLYVMILSEIGNAVVNWSDGKVVPQISNRPPNVVFPFYIIILNIYLFRYILEFQLSFDFLL